MKKQILLVAIFLFVGISFTSCKKDKKEDVKEEVITETVYQCPMDCEHGKIYSEPGKCPVCKMDLRSKKVESDSAHGHDQACKCMDGEKCTCPEGECKCVDEEKMAKSCKKCGDKECSCDMKKA